MIEIVKLCALLLLPAGLGLLHNGVPTISTPSLVDLFAHFNSKLAQDLSTVQANDRVLLLLNACLMDIHCLRINVHTSWDLVALDSAGTTTT